MIALDYKMKYDNATVVIAKQQALIEQKDQIIRAKNQEIKEQKRLLADLGKAYEEAKYALSDMRWRRRMDNVSKHRMNETKKKIVTALRDIAVEAPHTQFDDVQVRLKELSIRTNLSTRTIQENMDELASEKVIYRRYEGNGLPGQDHRQALFVKLDSQLMENPVAAINRLIPLEREEKRGGFRQPRKDEQPEMACPNCGDTHTRGTRQEHGLCDGCGRYFNVWIAFPEGIAETTIDISDQQYWSERLAI